MGSPWSFSDPTGLLRGVGYQTLRLIIETPDLAVASVAVFVVKTVPSASGLVCYCRGHCPSSGVRDAEGVCEAKPGARCFAAVQEVWDSNAQEFLAERTFGCLQPDDDGGLLQCRGHLVPHLQPTSIACCDNKDQCNRELEPIYESTPPFDAGVDEDPLLGAGAYSALLASLTLCFVFLVVSVAFAYLRYKRREDRRKRPPHMHTRLNPADNNRLARGGTLSDLLEYSSGSGGLPLLTQRTIAKEIQLVEVVGRGRYGQVWLANWRGEDVAAKVFYTKDEASWKRENHIYQSVTMRHDNILGFIAADIRGTGGCTQMLLITEYHPLGSLHDFLKGHLIAEDQLVNMAFSVACGLSFLHTEILGTGGRADKFAIAHRDIKSKNILVKRGLTCVIADFGLSVVYDSNSDSLGFREPGDGRIGTIRYMAPEELEQTGRLWCSGGAAVTFETFSRCDVYSMSLVLWEMCRRTKTATTEVVKKKSSSEESITSKKGSLLTLEEDILSYELPYFEYVGSDLSWDDMRAVVCVKKIRPSIPSHWLHSRILGKMSQLIQESWHSNPSARLPILRIKKDLADLKWKQHVDSVNLD